MKMIKSCVGNWFRSSIGGEDEWQSFDSPTIERPPLRHIDKYVRPECPCCDLSKRFTIAILASVGKEELHFFFNESVDFIVQINNNLN